MKALLLKVNHIFDVSSSASRFSAFPALPFIRSALIVAAIASATYALFAGKRSKSWIFAIGCIVLYFLLGIPAGLTSLLAFILFLLGGLLIFIEVIVPGFGVPGISGILLLVVSVALSMSGGVQVILTFLVAAIFIALIARRFFTEGEEMPLLKRFISDEPVAQPKPPLLAVGEEGKTLSPLRPSGTGEFDGRRVTIYSEGGFIDANRSVEVIAVRGHSIYVKEVSQ
ncbi:MAG: NfeD family protein [Peptoniphilus sp.]|nr:NfeD family protein [Peptoniphilus sp.]MDD7362747.1 NfeD family protein [Bacillota bacterium]MDY6044559.1 NfeD family protein [Peptoniphilus sp.]